jgi:hypothetical protein
MASTIIHLCVAKKVNNYLQKDEKLLSLGAIAPDISQQIGETKLKSHFLHSIDDPVPDCDCFVKKYYQELDNPFELGYLIHLLTDKYWFKYYLNNFISNHVDSSDLSVIAINKLIYNDYTRLNRDLIDDYMLDLDFFFNDFVYPKSKITEISMAKIPILINKMSLIIANVDEHKPKLFNEPEIIDFIEHISNQIIIDLKNYHIV